MDSGWVVVVQLDFSLNSAPFCFWTQTLRVEFGDLSRDEQEPSLTIVLTLTLPTSNIVTVIEFMVSNPQHILHTTFSSSHITSKSTINLCIWHLLTRKLYLMKFTSRPQAVHPKVLLMTNAMASYKGRFQNQDYKALLFLFSALKATNLATLFWHQVK